MSQRIGFLYPGNQGTTQRLLMGCLSRKDSKVSSSQDRRCRIIQICHKKGHYANNCPDAKGKEGKSFLKVRPLEDLSNDKKTKNRSDRSESAIQISTVMITILSYAIRSRYMIRLGRFATLPILSIWLRCS